jgi:hypothetical protein
MGLLKWGFENLYNTGESFESPGSRFEKQVVIVKTGSVRVGLK